jgi:alkylation response protein AidB-like acyl-CoA dehydrogenase
MYRKEAEMDFRFSPEDEAFRQEIRAELARLLPADIRARTENPVAQPGPAEDQRRWFQILDEKGWAAPHWPTEYGGTDWSPLRRFIFEDEMHAAQAPEFNWSGTHMIGPVIYAFGSPEQKARFLAPTRRGEIFWAQGFSEPGSGSDLASLRTHARLEGDRYIVNGQKIWTSGAFEADWGFFLVKTDLTVKPQRGISFLLIDMKTPGLTVRRIPQLNGDAHLCEVFLDNVEAPVENLVGEPGQGWTYAKYLLEHERTTSSFIFWSKRELARARRIAESEQAGGQPLIARPDIAARLARLQADLLGLEWSVLRVLAEDTTGGSLAVAASILKVRGSDLQQAVTELQVDLLAARAIRYYPPEPGTAGASAEWPAHVPGRTSVMQITRAATIYGGSKQVQKNILAKLAFQL